MSHDCDIDCWDCFEVKDFGLWGYSMYCAHCRMVERGAEHDNTVIGARYSEEEDSHTLGDLIVAARNHCKENHR